MRLTTAFAVCLLASGAPPLVLADGEARGAFAADAASLSAAAGRFILVEELDDPYLVGLQYRGVPRTGWSLRPGIGADIANGERVGAEYALQFRSGISVSCRLASGRRLGLAGYHISNGGLVQPNAGTETVVLFLAMPVRR